MITIQIRKNDSKDSNLSTQTIFTKEGKDNVVYVWGVLEGEDNKYAVMNGTLKDKIAKVDINKTHSGKFYYKEKGVLIAADQDKKQKIEALIQNKINEGYTAVQLEQPLVS